MKLKKYITISVFALCIIYSLFNSQKVFFYTKNAILMCFYSLIPSLFIFIVLTRLISSSFSEYNFGSKVSSICARFFGISSSLLPICLISVFCGTPSSCIGICDTYKKGLCSKAQAENACALSGFCSMSFIFGFAGSLLGDGRAALIIFISDFLSVLTIYFLFIKSDSEEFSASFCSNTRTDLSQKLTNSVSLTLYDLMTLSSYVIFFYTISSLFCEKASVFMQGMGADYTKISAVQATIFSLFEMTSGATACDLLSGYGKILMMSFCTSFMGISIFFQVTSFMSSIGLSSKKFIKARLLCGLLSPLYSVILLYIFPISRPVFNQIKERGRKGLTLADLVFIILSTVICLIGAEILNYFDKKHKK